MSTPPAPTPQFTPPKPLSGVQRRLLEPFVESAQSFLLANAPAAQAWTHATLQKGYAFATVQVDKGFALAVEKVRAFKL